jgi:hypothetical protein
MYEHIEEASEVNIVERGMSRIPSRKKVVANPHQAMITRGRSKTGWPVRIYLDPASQQALSMR